MTENPPTQPSRQHGESESSQSTPSGEMKVSTTDPEGKVLRVKPKNYQRTLQSVHQTLLEKEQGIVKPAPKEPED